MRIFSVSILLFFITVVQHNAHAFEPISADELFKEVNIVSMSLSPKGDYVLEVARTDEQKILNLIETETFKKYRISTEAIDQSTKVRNYSWLDNSTLYVKEEYESHIINIDSSGASLKVEWLKIPVSGQILSKKIDVDGNIIFAKTSGEYGEFYKVYQVTIAELLSDDFTLFQSYGIPLSNAIMFYLDNTSNILMALTYEDGEAQMWYLPPKDTFWSRLHRYEIEDKFIPLAFINDSSLAVLTNKDANYTYLAQFDIKKKEITKVLYKAPSNDITDARFTDNGKLHSVSYIARGIIQTEYFSPAAKSLKSSLERKVTDRHFAIINTNQLGSLHLILAHASNSPDEFYLFKSTAKKLRKLGSIRKNLTKYSLAKADVFNVNISNELSLEGIVTKPTTASNGVLLVNPHGGPIGVRNDASFNLSNQFYASRGYTILNVNFRGSSGYGKVFENQGRGQFGQLIEQDIMSVYLDFIKSNKFDYTCAMGASYGGYSAVMLAIKHPEYFQCAISVFGVFDLPHLFNTNNHRLAPSKQKSLKKVLGDDMATLRAISPIKLAHKLQVPALILAGKDDKIAPFEQSNRMKYTLQRLGKEVTFHAYENTGHGHPDWDGVIHEHETIDQFLQTIRTNYTPTVNSFKLNDLNLTELLLKKSADVDAQDEQGYSLLHHAIEVPDTTQAIKLVKLLLRYDVYSELEDKLSRTPLFLATEQNKTELAKLLISQGANINTQNKHGDRLLFTAAGKGNVPLTRDILEVDLGIEKQSPDGLTPLMNAAHHGKLAVIKLLVDYGADVHAVNTKADNKTALDYAKAKKHTDVINYLSSADRGQPATSKIFRAIVYKLGKDDVDGALEDIPLLIEVNEFDLKENTSVHHAVKLKNEDDCISVLKVLIAQGADLNRLNYRKRSPLYMAVAERKPKVVQFLLENGADLNQPGRKGWTPLMAAISRGQVEIVKMMSLHTMDFTIKSNNGGWPALLYTTNRKHKAKDKNQAEIAKLLIEKGANTEVKTRSGRTALMNAANNGKFHVVRALVEADADINAVNVKDDNKTPLDYAIQDGHDDIADYLRNVLHWKKT